jgi:5-methylcytosine-specific restriction protein A
MPTKLCNHPGCPEPATYRGRCAAHSRQRNRETHRNRSFYNSKRWKLLRRRILFLNPLCQCDDPDCTEIATDVHHIVDMEDGGDPWSMTNLQALTAVCHSRITNKRLRTK